MEMQIIDQVTKRETVRCRTGSPSTSISSVAFSTCRYQKYVVGVVRIHSGSEVNWLWRKLQDQVPPPFFPSPPPSNSIPSSVYSSLFSQWSSSFFIPPSFSQPSHLPFSSLSSHQNDWSSSVRGTLPKAVGTGKTDPNRRDSKP